MIDLSFKLDSKLVNIKDTYTTEKLSTDFESLITAMGGISKIQDGIFNCGI